MASSKAYLYPRSRVGASPDTTHSADDTGTWSGSTDPGDIDDLNGAPNHGDYIVTGLGPGPGYQTRHWFARYSFTAPLPAIGITTLRARAWFGCPSQSGQALVVGVDLEAFLEIGGTRYTHATVVSVPGTPGFVGFDPQEYTWEWTVNPDTGLDFTVADLQTIQAGLRFVATSDPTATNTPE